MKSSRRRFLKTAGVACTAATPLSVSTALAADEPRRVTKAELDRILDTPVLDTSSLKQPVTVASIELLRNGRNFLVRVRSTDGVEAITVPNPARMRDFYRVFLGLVPVFVKKDARHLESLLWDAYRHNSNYKLQGLALWTNVAAMEMALLELMGQTAQRPPGPARTLGNLGTLAPSLFDSYTGLRGRSWHSRRTNDDEGTARWLG